MSNSIQSDRGIVARGLMVPVYLCVPAILISIGISAFTWLKTGEGWSPPMANLFAWFGWGCPQVSWVGAQKIIDAYMGMDARFAAPISAAILFFVASHWVADLHRQEKFDQAQKAKFIGPPAPRTRSQKFWDRIAIGWFLFIILVLVAVSVF